MTVEQYRRDGRVHLQVTFGCTGNAPAAKRSGCLSARCTCGEAVRFPDERSEELCEAKSQEGAREPRRGRKGPRQHRSVYFAERMAERLAIIDGIEVAVVHSAKPWWKTETGGNGQ